MTDRAPCNSDCAPSSRAATSESWFANKRQCVLPEIPFDLSAVNSADMDPLPSNNLQAKGASPPSRGERHHAQQMPASLDIERLFSFDAYEFT